MLFQQNSTQSGYIGYTARKGVQIGIAVAPRRLFHHEPAAEVIGVYGDMTQFKRTAAAAVWVYAKAKSPTG